VEKRKYSTLAGNRNVMHDLIMGEKGNEEKEEEGV
jgi:hypothetical protein